MFIGKCVLGIFVLFNLLFAYYHAVNHDICKVVIYCATALCCMMSLCM